MRFTILQLFVAFAVVSSIKAMALPAAEDQTDLDDAEWLKMLSEDSSKLEKRKFGPNDPRSLFQAAYSDYRSKRAPDPRSLFQSVYKLKRAADPRSLFQHVYSNYNGGGFRKRYEPLEEMYYAPPAPLYSGSKRGFRNPQDPRNLFRAVYGW